MVNIMSQFGGGKQHAKYSHIASLDKHSRSSYGVVADRRSGRVIFDRNILGGNQPVIRTLSKVINPKRTLVVMEAGGHGFSAYRQFRKAGFGCKLVAPSSKPKRGKEQKTDRDDAINQLHYHNSGLLHYVWVPAAEDEDARELMRFRYQQQWKIGKQKQLIQSLLRRHGAEYTLTKTPWTLTHRHWLKTVELLPCTRLVLDSMLEQLESLEQKLEALDRELDHIFATTEKYSTLCVYYRLLAGVGRVGAMTLILEGFDLRRFAHALNLMSYTGLIPKKHSSADRDPDLRITKAGNKFLRIALVGAGKFYRDRRMLTKKAKLQAYPEIVREFIQRCQERLHYRYRHLCAKGKNSNKAKVAVARELCGFLWELVNKVIPQIHQEDFEALRKAA